MTSRIFLKKIHFMNMWVAKKFMTELPTVEIYHKIITEMLRIGFGRKSACKPMPGFDRIAILFDVSQKLLNVYYTS